jgi:putative acetyltransferase
LHQLLRVREVLASRLVHHRPTDSALDIREDDPRRAAPSELLREHLRAMHAQSPAESVHALDIDDLCGPDVTFWTACRGPELLGCGALRELDPAHGEIKSMRTAASVLRQGVGSALLEHILAVAEARGYSRLSLETGSMDTFAPARSMYARYGFAECAPFADYHADPNSVFMTLALPRQSLSEPLA